MRSTAAHNTIRVDGLEQNSISQSPRSVFALGNEARVGPISSENSPAGCRLKASHFGYERTGVVHTRILFWGTGNEIIIEDEIAGQGKRSVEANFVLGPAWKVDSVDRQDGETVCGLAGPRRAHMCFRAAAPIEVNRETTPISRLFGQYRDVDKLSIHMDCTLPVTIRTIVRWEDGETGLSGGGNEQLG
jgi:hypothetical protein